MRFMIYQPQAKVILDNLIDHTTEEMTIRHLCGQLQLRIMDLPAVFLMGRISIVPHIGLEELHDLRGHVAQLHTLLIEELTEFSDIRLMNLKIVHARSIVSLNKSMKPSTASEWLCDCLRLKPEDILIVTFLRRGPKRLNHGLGSNWSTRFFVPVNRRLLKPVGHQ